MLVADRDGSAARLLGDLIRRLGLRAYHTTRGEEALRVAEAQPMQLAVIDVALQDMAGPQLARRLRTLDPALPVVMTTGDFRPEVEVQAREAGIVHYAHKPLDDDRLEAVLRKVLSAPVRSAPAGPRAPERGTLRPVSGGRGSARAPPR